MNNNRRNTRKKLCANYDRLENLLDIRISVFQNHYFKIQTSTTLPFQSRDSFPNSNWLLICNPIRYRRVDASPMRIRPSCGRTKVFLCRAVLKTATTRKTREAKAIGFTFLRCVFASCCLLISTTATASRKTGHKLALGQAFPSPSTKRHRFHHQWRKRTRKNNTRSLSHRNIFSISI